jgi:hypothetical protein
MLMLSSYLRLLYMIPYQVFRPNSVIISHHSILLYTSPVSSLLISLPWPWYFVKYTLWRRLSRYRDCLLAGRSGYRTPEGGDLPYPSRPARRATQPTVPWVPRFLPTKSSADVKVRADLYLYSPWFWMPVVGRSLLLRRVRKNWKAAPCLSVLPPAWNTSAPIGRIFMKFDIGVVFENLSRNSGLIKLWQE